MNLVKRSSVERGTKSRIRASGRVEALVGVSLLLALNPQIRPWSASSFCSPVGLAGGLTQGLHRVQNSGAIAMEI